MYNRNYHSNSYPAQNKPLNKPQNVEKKPLRYSNDSFVKELIGSRLKITLLNGKEEIGKLLELGMYDIKVQTSEAQLIILKSAIATVQVIQ